MTMTIEQFSALSREDRDAAIYAQNEATRELVKDDTNRTIGFTYQTLGGFWRGYSFRAGCGVGPFDSRELATEWVATRQPVANYSR